MNIAITIKMAPTIKEPPEMLLHNFVYLRAGESHPFNRLPRPICLMNSSWADIEQACDSIRVPKVMTQSKAAAVSVMMEPLKLTGHPIHHSITLSEMYIPPEASRYRIFSYRRVSVTSMAYALSAASWSSSERLVPTVFAGTYACMFANAS